MTKQSYGEKITKMETDIEYIKQAIDELKQNSKELRNALENQFKTFTQELDKKVDRVELWKIITVAVSLTGLILSLLLRIVP